MYTIPFMKIDPIDQFTSSFRPLIVSEKDLYGKNYNFDSPTKTHKFSLFEKCKFIMYVSVPVDTQFVWDIYK